ncbi:MAG: hypothetical protein GY820_03930 [Gammaproteobacteria bacterium]|nr:hypothetical protein [Gammaproteobacteria bacterium]
MKKILLFSMLTLLASCAVRHAIPLNYTGPIAIVQETAVRVDQGKAKMFFLNEIDGVYVSDNSSSRSFSESYRKGNNLTIIDSPYEIPAEQHTYTITGSHVWAMDGRAILEADLDVSGEVKFTPVEGRTYLINGSLSEEESTVWIKDTESGEIIAEFKKQDP